MEPLISTEQLASRLSTNAGGETVVFDCRFNLMKPGQGRAAWLESHIPGAFYAHLDHDLAGPITDSSGRHPLPDSDTFSRWLDQHGVDEDSVVVAYDGGPGAIAARLWWMLRWLGHDRVAVLDGGWKKWVSEDRPVDQAVPEMPAGSASSYRSPRQADWLTSAQLVDSLQGVTLVDARSPDRFAGAAEPIDRRAGHIPGAINSDFMLNLGEDGTFLSADALRQRYVGLLENSVGDTDSVVHSCGSGVTACHNLLAMEVAGLSGSKLYAGSWSEWIADESRPIAVGSSE